MKIEPTGESCGAIVTGIDLMRSLAPSAVQRIRDAWLEYHVLAFPNQKLNDDGLERFAEYFGPIGDDPYFEPAEGKERITAVERKADEKSRIFADSWHSDWSFKSVPPAGTCLLGVDIPPKGGDTLFINEHLALKAMPDDLRARFDGKIGIHSARKSYAEDGKYAKGKYGGSMRITPSNDAYKTQAHPIIRIHPESGFPGIFAGAYVIDIYDEEEQEVAEILSALSLWLSRPEFIYRHKWEPDMLLLWDNRSVLHKATGGYEGYTRLLHRLTIADDASYYNK